MPDPNLTATMAAWHKVAIDQRLTPILMLVTNPKSQGVMVLSPGMAQQLVQVHGVGRPWPDEIRRLADDLLGAVAKHLQLATEDTV